MPVPQTHTAGRAACNRPNPSPVTFPCRPCIYSMYLLKQKALRLQARWFIKLSVRDQDLPVGTPSPVSGCLTYASGTYSISPHSPHARFSQVHGVGLHGETGWRFTIARLWLHIRTCTDMPSGNLLLTDTVSSRSEDTPEQYHFNVKWFKMVSPCSNNIEVEQ